RTSCASEVSSVTEPGGVASDPFQRFIIAKEAPVDTRVHLARHIVERRSNPLIYLVRHRGMGGAPGPRTGLSRNARTGEGWDGDARSDSLLGRCHRRRGVGGCDRGGRGGGTDPGAKGQDSATDANGGKNAGCGKATGRAEAPGRGEAPGSGGAAGCGEAPGRREAADGRGAEGVRGAVGGAEEARYRQRAGEGGDARWPAPRGGDDRQAVQRYGEAGERAARPQGRRW